MTYFSRFFKNFMESCVELISLKTKKGEPLHCHVYNLYLYFSNLVAHLQPFVSFILSFLKKRNLLQLFICNKFIWHLGRVVF